MNRTEPHFVSSEERVQSSPKRVLRNSKDNYAFQSRPDLFHDCHEEPTSAPDTPGMTTDSTRSATSSIVACDSCGNPTHHCQCSSQSQSDVESVHFHNSETESIPASPVFPSPQRKELFRPPRTYLQCVVDAHIANATPKAKRSFSPLASTGERFSNNDQQAQELPLRLRDVNCSLENVAQLRSCNANPVFDDSGSEMTDDEDESMDEEDDSNDWGGPDASLEAVVLEAMGGDEALAAQLIPFLHKNFQSEIAQKVTPWRSAVTEHNPSTQGAQYSSDPNSSQLPANPRKRRRHHGSDQDPEDDEDDDDDEGEDRKNSRELEEDIDANSPIPSPRLACPFYKLNPSKYRVQHDTSEYRACGGPGFKNIQRLKEHLKRKHYPVQCDRCYNIFPGSDRASSVLALEAHRQIPNPCQRRDSALKEGISDAQWAKLDKKRSPKKTQPSRIEKYWEIWDIIFPGQQRPKTPWYDGSAAHASPFSESSLAFSQMFTTMLSLQVNDQQIRFPDGYEDQMLSRLQILAQKAFSTYVGLHGLPSSTRSRSTRSRPQSSLLGGSYGFISNPSHTRGQHSSSSASLSTAARSRAYSIDMQSTSTGPVMMTDPRNQGPMAPPFIPMVQQNNFMNNPLGVTIQNHQPQMGYNSAVADSIGNYDSGNYTWDMEFDATATEMTAGPSATNMNVGSFASDPRSSMNQPRVSHSDQAHDLTGLGWQPQIQESQSRHYGQQQ